MSHRDFDGSTLDLGIGHHGPTCRSRPLRMGEYPSSTDVTDVADDALLFLLEFLPPPLETPVEFLKVRFGLREASLDPLRSDTSYLLIEEFADLNLRSINQRVQCDVNVRPDPTDLYSPFCSDFVQERQKALLMQIGLNIIERRQSEAWRAFIGCRDEVKKQGWLSKR
jgi:hypothetical protein